MLLKADEIKRRIEAARLLRNISQKELDALGRADGFGAVEMGRVERGELEFRPGKHLDPLCRYLRVPRWWFTAETLDFGGLDAPAPPDEVASLLAQQNALLQRQSEILTRIERATQQADGSAQTLDGTVKTLSELVEQARRDLPPVAVQGRPAAAEEPGAKSTTRAST
jgi:hypothetical protein